MKNVQKPEKIHLGKLIEEIKKGRFIIPDFQREFDWEPWDIRELIKSIFMDYYIGTLLLWEGNEESYKKLSCNDIFGFQGKSDPEYIVLDGQQRLTAMHYAFFQPDVPYRKRKNPILYLIDLDELMKENYDDAFYYYNKTNYYGKLIVDKNLQYEDNIFPLGIMQEGSWGIDDWLKGYKDFWEEELERFMQEEYGNENDEEETDAAYVKRVKKYIVFAYELKEMFKDLLNNYQISYIELDKKIEVGKVCDIFTHINSRGVKLDTFDLLNAITRPKDIFLKKMYREASNVLDDNNYPGFEIKSYILMVMSLVKQNYCSPKYLYYLVPGEVKKIKGDNGKVIETVLIEDAETFVYSWENAVEAIRKGLQALKNPRDFGAISSKFLPYPSIIPALSAVKAYVADEDLKNKVDIHSKIRKWYWASIFLNRYSSSVESTSTRDYMALKRWFNDEDEELECVADFYREYKHIDLHKEVRNASAIYKAIFNLFILNEARDWETFDLPEYDSLDDHHIVPKSWGKDNELGQEINTILNKTPLSPDTNRRVIHDDLPNLYLKKLFDNNDKEKVYSVLKSHLISRKAVDILLRIPFTVDDYNAFIDERRQTIIQAIENILIKEKIDLPENLKVIDKELEKIEISIRNLIIQKLQISSVDEIKAKLPQHVVDKIKNRIDRDRRRNPVIVEEGIERTDFWMQFSDLQELQQIITNKNCWPEFTEIFISKEKVTNEFNDLANLRNGIRHSREIDRITQMKGEASLLWFKLQLNMK